MPWQADLYHVMAITRHDIVSPLGHRPPVNALFNGLARQKWKRRSCGSGT
ncbi:hypothetical protein [Streptomyces avidinii]